MGGGVRLRGRGSGRRVRDERAAVGHLRVASALVTRVFSGDAASLFSSGKPGGHGGLLGHRIVDAGGEPVLLDLTARRRGGDVSGAKKESAAGDWAVCVLRSHGAGRDRNGAAAEGSDDLGALGKFLDLAHNVVDFARVGGPRVI